MSNKKDNFGGTPVTGKKVDKSKRTFEVNNRSNSNTKKSLILLLLSVAIYFSFIDQDLMKEVTELNIRGSNNALVLMSDEEVIPFIKEVSKNKAESLLTHAVNNHPSLWVIWLISFLLGAIGALCITIRILVSLIMAFSGAKSDKRFKTGYKNNLTQADAMENAKSMTAPLIAPMIFGLKWGFLFQIIFIISLLYFYDGVGSLILPSLGIYIGYIFFMPFFALIENIF